MLRLSRTGYLVIDLKRKRSRVVKTLEEAARIVEADADDSHWTIALP